MELNGSRATQKATRRVSPLSKLEQQKGSGTKVSRTYRDVHFAYDARSGGREGQTIDNHDSLSQKIDRDLIKFPTDWLNTFE
ncbi:hypothetical protein SFRURICE_005887 [Spodoptera frugiperda]|nr:hypothetical protein SFRURICE_005887 [Spodoptera frugiperda]